MFEDLANDLLIFDKCNYAHCTETLRTYERIDFVDFLYQSRPISPESLAGQLRFKEAGDFTVDVSLFSFSTRNIAIKSVITSHLLALVGHVRAHGSQPFQCVDYLGFLPVFGPVLHLAGFPMVVHTFLGERCSDNPPTADKFPGLGFLSEA
jgi:hypothetical protein